MMPIFSVKFIHFFLAGVDAWANHWIIKDSEIPLTTSSGIHGPPIAEWILMTTLVASKHYAIFYESQKEHRYGAGDKHLRETEDWVGKRVGIAGYGSIGRQGNLKMFSSLNFESQQLDPPPSLPPPPPNLLFQ
jgi:phosphoglycerate dehydrogenase-like enzyme